MPHSTIPKPSWYGESIGHYENGDSWWSTPSAEGQDSHRQFRTPHTELLHVVERFKLIENGNTLQVLIEVDDPGAFTMPWRAMQRFKRFHRGPMTESICAENNFEFLGYSVVPLPVAGKPDFSVSGDDDDTFGFTLHGRGAVNHGRRCIGHWPRRRPNFATTANTGWVLDRAIGTDDLLAAPGGGPGPVTFDKKYPYIPNGNGRQSTYRVADLSNPILQDWLKPSMKEWNDKVIAGKVPFRARERCWPVGVPRFRCLFARRAVLFLPDERQSRRHQPGRPRGAAHLPEHLPFQKIRNRPGTENRSAITRTAIRS